MLNCNVCIHKVVCENKEVGKELWEALTLNDKFQTLQNRGFTITPSCVNYKEVDKPKILGELIMN